MERVYEYVDLPAEETLEQLSKKLAVAESWPARGHVKMRDVSLRYRPGLDLALKVRHCFCTVFPLP